MHTRTPAISYNQNTKLWTITGPPNVLLRAKRWFDGAYLAGKEQLSFTDTTATRRDIDAFLHRFPDIHTIPEHRKLITDGTTAHKNREKAVTTITHTTTQYHTTPNPDYTPRDYQKAAYNLINVTHGHGGLLLADELGLGKTITSLQSLTNPENRPALVVTLTGLEQQWVRELGKLFPDLTAHIARTRKPYDPTALGTWPDLIVMNYAKLQGWPETLAGNIKTVIFDEVQELRIAHTKKHDAAKIIADQATHRWGLSATPVGNYGGEIYNIMTILAPDAIGGQHEFDREWCQTLYNNKKSIREPEALRSWLISEGVLLRRTRQDANINIPEVTIVEHEIPHTLLGKGTDTTLTDYATTILDTDTTPEERFTASSELSWRLRQDTGLRKANAVAHLAKAILATEPKLILAGWHRAVWDTWQTQLADYNPVLYTGTETPTQKHDAYTAFTEGNARILMMSLRSGAGLDGLQDTCNVVLFGELDWSPAVHKQLIGRLHRPGQHHPVTAYFAHAPDGADPVILDTLDIKRLQADLLIAGETQTQPIDQTNRIQALAKAVLNRK